MRLRLPATAHMHWLGARRLGKLASIGLSALSLAAGGGCNEQVSLGAWLAVETDQVTDSTPPPSSVSSPTPAATPPATTPMATVPPSPPLVDAGPSPIDASMPPPADAGPPLRLDSSPGLDSAIVDAGFPGCGKVGTPGRLNRAGATVGPTIAFTDWAWPQPLDSVEFDLEIELEPTNNLAFWAYQFGFVSGIGGLLGLQANGGYQSDPPTGAPVWTKMAILWIAGPPLDAALGDVMYPDARIAPEYSKGVAWTSIHLLYPWEVCRVYRFRLAFESTDGAGDRWYGAWITDTVTDSTTYVGHMLAPQEWGQLSVSSSMWTDGLIDPQNLQPRAPVCADLEPVSAVFGAPIGNDGAVEPLSFNNRFDGAPKCGSSRFTEFPDAIRQEHGAVPAP